MTTYTVERRIVAKWERWSRHWLQGAAYRTIRNMIQPYPKATTADWRIVRSDGRVLYQVEVSRPCVDEWAAERGLACVRMKEVD